jgi:transcriptional regulator with XRE-family HTH domain
MNGASKQGLVEELGDKQFRDAYVAEHLRTGVAYQIRALREKRGWSQAELGRRTGKPQSAVSRLEDPDYGRLSLKTLLELAAAFDVALMIRFVAFSELLERTTDLSPEALAVADFARDSLQPTPLVSGSLREQMRDWTQRASSPHVSVLQHEPPRQFRPSVPLSLDVPKLHGGVFSSLQQDSLPAQRPRLAALGDSVP